MSPSVTYTLATPCPENHLFEVELALLSERDEVCFSLPDWIPGSYMIRDYARHVVSIEARVEGELVPVEKTGKSRWCVSGARGELVLRYRVYAFDRSVRGSYLDHTGWLANGVCVFLRVEHGVEALHCVHVKAPEKNGHWSLVTTLESRAVDANGFGEYRADGYEALIDNPLLAGELQQAQFSVYGVPHSVAVAGHVTFDQARLTKDLASICETHVQLFGEPPPMSRYVFMVTVGGERGGGLEHRDCCVLSVPRDQLPGAAVSAEYTDLLSLASHEYFHAWLVKRIRPAALVKAPLDREVHTRSLWIFEGITSYYDELALLRAGLLTPVQYLERTALLLSRVQRGAGRLEQSLEASSFDTWTRFYKQDENAANAIVSYYAKGALVALCLDLVLRQRSDGAVSLDTVMRKLWRSFGDGDGLPEDGFEALVQALSSEDLSAFFDQALRGVTDLPYDHYLAAQGVSLTWRPVEHNTTWGGYVLKSDSSVVSVVHAESPAQVAGLSPGDQIVAWDGARYDGTRDLGFRESAGVARPVALTVFRNDQLLSLTLTLAEAPKDVCILESKVGFEPRRDQWLYGHV